MRPPRMTTWQSMVAVAFAATLFGLGYCSIRHIRTHLQIAFADEQTAIFDQMRRQTAESAAVDASYLEYALRYYPSGTKQTEGSELDRVVERARQCAVREIIDILRARTRKEFGDDPRRWIEGLRADGADGTKPGG